VGATRGAGIEDHGADNRVKPPQARAQSRRLMASGLGLALLLVMLADTALRGPLTAHVEAVNAAVVAWGDAGFPIHPVGRVLSMLGDFMVLVPVLAVAVGICAWRRQWGRVAAIVVTSLAAPGIVRLLQPALSPLNRPMPGLDPYLVPDTDSPLRVAGEHLFPSGHLVEATVGWGLLAFVAIPVLVAARGMPPSRARLLHRVAIATWAAAIVLTAAGRMLRQAHGYNDVLAGWGLGCAILFAALWAVERFLPLREVPNG